LGKLEAIRHLISGWLLAIAGLGKLEASAAMAAAPVAALAKNFRRSIG
jgi:hypothetical protein